MYVGAGKKTFSQQLNGNVAMRRFAKHLLSTGQDDFAGAGKLAAALVRVGIMDADSARCIPPKNLLEGMPMIAAGIGAKNAFEAIRTAEGMKSTFGAISKGGNADMKRSDRGSVRAFTVFTNADYSGQPPHEVILQMEAWNGK